ncbi:MAG: hypothetical protein ACR2NR_19440 [Solirubrobacteraceae bacterium]
MLLLAGPALLTHNGFIDDYTNHLWLVWVQESAISHHLLPTYFISAPQVGVFYPVFEFYGGTSYAATGALAALLGDRVVVAYVASIMLAVASAYGGLLWLARQLGVRSWLAHAPAIAFVTSAYYVTNLYGRGAWTEFVATSSIPLLAAGGVRLARAPRVELRTATLFVLAAIVFIGTHNVTLLLGTVTMIILGGAFWWALGARPRDLPRRRLLAVVGLLVLATGVDAWSLLPNLIYASRVGISSQAPNVWTYTGFFNSPGVLFNPLRSVPSASTTPGLYVQAADWFLAWALVAAFALWSAAGRRLRRAAMAVAVVLVLLLAVTMIGPLWNALPTTLRQVQFPYRLDTYISLCIAALVLIGALALQRERRPGLRRGLLGRGLGLAAAVSITLCVWQLGEGPTDSVKSYRNRSAVFQSTHLTPRTWYDESYTDASARIVYTGDRQMFIDPYFISGDHQALTVTPPPGTAPFATNITGGPYAVHVPGGIVPVGRTPEGHVVARRRNTVSGPVRITLSAAGGAIAAGKVISAISLLAVLGLLLVAAVSRATRRRRSVRSA